MLGSSEPHLSLAGHWHSNPLAHDIWFYVSTRQVGMSFGLSFRKWEAEQVCLSVYNASAFSPCFVMSTTLDIKTVIIVIWLIIGWYIYQIASRKTKAVWFKTKRLIVSLVCYLTATYILSQQRLPPIEAVFFGALAGLGSAWLLVKSPTETRRIPKAIRRQVIARDLTSKGLTWDPAKHHIDHLVPFSRGGDNSLRNLRVIEKQRNLRKGGRMPRPLDFLRK